MGRPIINAAALRARRPTSSSAAPTRELDGELDEGHTAGTTDKVGAGVEEANEHSELESDDEEDDNGVMDQDEDDEDAEDDDDDDDDDSNQIEEDVMDEDEGQDELQQDADEDLLDGHEGDRPVAEGNPQEVHDDNAEDEESPSREQEEEPMTMEELISVLQSENGDILAAGLHRFHAALRRLAERKVDREISAESDLFREYLKSSPECAELFRIWDFESKNQVEKLQSIVPKVIARAIFASRLVNARATGVTMIRRIVKSYMRIVYRNLSSNRQPVMHGAIVLLSAMSTHTAPCTKELYEAFDFTLKALPTCLKARKESGKQKNSGPGADLRTPYIRFILGFLTLGDAAIKQAVLESKNTIAIFKGVMGDSYGTISLLLSVLQKKVVEDGTISRNVKFTFFNTSTLEQLTKLYARSDRENPNNISEDGESTVADVVHNFLWNLCTIPGKGICNVGPGWFSNPAASKGKSQGGTLLRWLTSLHPHQSLLHQQILLEVLKNCPDLVHLYWEGQSAVSFEPRLSQRWLSNMAVAAKVLALPVPDLVERWQRSTIGLGLPTVSVLADNILPTPLGRLLLGRCLQHSSNTVRHASSYVLGLSMDKFGRVNNQLKELADIEAAEADAANGTNENRWLSLSRQLREEMRRRIPDFQLILLQQNPKERPAISEKKKDDEDSPVLQPVDRAEIEEDPSITPEVLKGEGLKLIRLYQRHFPELVTESRFDYGKLIPADLTSLSEEMQENVLGLLLELKDFKWWNHPAGSNQSHLYSILRHHVSAESPAMAALSKKLIIHFLTNSILFESRDEELECWFLAIHLILDSLPSREAKSTAPVLNWLDEALCAGTRTVYKLVDRLQKLMEQANENMTDREKQSVIHFNETRVQWLSLGGREFDVSSLELSFPFAPAFICCLDGIAAMLKKHMAELSAGWPEKLIQASKFVFFAMSKTLAMHPAVGRALNVAIASIFESFESLMSFPAPSEWTPLSYIQYMQILSRHCCESSDITAAPAATSDHPYTKGVPQFTEKMDVSVVDHLFQSLSDDSATPPLLVSQIKAIVELKFPLLGDISTVSPSVTEKFLELMSLSTLLRNITWRDINDTTESILEQGLSACLEREIKDEASVFPIAARLLTHLHMALQNHLLRGARICVCGLTHLLNHARAFHAKAATFSRQRAERRFVCIRNFIFGSPTLLNHFSNAAADLTIAKDLSQLIAHQLEKDNQEMSTILITECFKPYFDYLTETILTFVLDTDENSLPHSNYVAESFTLLRPYFDVKSLDEIVEAFLTSPSKAENFLVMRLAGEALKPGASRQGQGLSESRHLSCTAFRQVISLLPATNMSDVMVKVIYSHSLPKPFFEKDETLMPTFVHNDQGSSLLDIFPLFDESRVTNLFSAVTNTSVQSFFLASSPIHLLSAFRKGASSDLATLAAFTANPAFSSFKSLPPLEQFRPTLLQVLDEIKSDIVTGADVSATTASLNVAVVTKILSENAFAGLREACAAEMLKSLTSAELSRPAEVCSALKIYWEALCVVFDAVPGSADGHRNSAKLAGMTIRVLRLYIKSKKRFAFTGQELNEETTFGFLIEQISLLIQWFKLNDDATQLFLELDGEEDTLIAFFVSCLKYRFQDPRAIQLLVSLLELLYNEKVSDIRRK
ncbi:ribosome 60S biogenesis N-terminal-domain-containing protein [Zopfochytrium polystomum]|nr:ribosome 60S biogenesis N-terminal-domain-containing protein [Zopfochytrium polystomum]